MASVLISFLMMITRRKAVAQVIGFLAMENGLFFAATSATYGMPMVVELGIALDVLVGVLIFGVFFFQIRETSTVSTSITWKAQGQVTSAAAGCPLG
jgi:hydrogenase-4 component E